MEMKLKGDAIVCPFSEYLNEKKKWQEKHPDAIIKEEIKNLFMVMQDMKGLKLAGVPDQVQVLMIVYAVVFEEPTSIPMSEVKFTNEL